MSIFKYFPIEFKQINPEDFTNFEVGEKIRIQPNENGYIKDSLKTAINLNEKNTVVINAGVGQGKTVAILDIVKDYYHDPNTVVFIASPFVSLVEQYYKDVLELGISENDVFRYEVLGNEELPDFWLKRIHIVTANCLLGNPGDDAFINSNVKRYYLDRLKDHCERKGKKVIFIYDEIHDAIHNFKEQYIFNLWKWRNVIHKNFIISATFNEASKVVIEYLAELTDDKIQIVECERKRLPEKQSALYLHYNDEKFYKYDDPLITNLVRDLVEEGKEIDILSYSRKLSNDIIENADTGIGYELYQKYDEINNCTSELIFNQRGDRATPQNRYNGERCNVGTNFKTGVSIKKDNHAFIIILPPKGSKTPFSNNYGIFTHAVNSVIQALARQRVKGEIHLVLPKPFEFKYSSLPFEEVEQVEYFKDFYEKIKDSQPVDKPTEYIPLFQQDEILFDFYENTLKKKIEKEVEYVESLSRKNKVRLSFPEYKLYKLDKSEDYLAEKTQFFGGDLSAYITYSAITNQFLNCNFKGARGKEELVLKYGEIQQGLNDFFQSSNFFNDDRMSLYHYLNDTAFYNNLRNELFELYSIKLVTTDNKIINLLKNGSSGASEYFENQLLGFVQSLKNPNNPTNKAKFRDIEGNYKDGIYDRSQYLLEVIAQAKDEQVNDSMSQETKDRINAFKYLGILKERLVENIQYATMQNTSAIKYLPNIPFSNFIPSNETEQFNNAIEILSESQTSLGRRFNLKNRFSNKTHQNKIKTLYRILVEDFFIAEAYRLPTGSRANVKKIKYIIPLPDKSNVINFVNNEDYKFPDGDGPQELTEDLLNSIKSDLENNT